MAKKLSLTQRWMIENPRDKPCPRDPNAARAWRRKRGLDVNDREPAKPEMKLTEPLMSWPMAAK